MKRTRLTIERTWDGEGVGGAERVTLDLELGETALVCEADAPFHDDPPPSLPAGSCDGLWEFEVVELFLLGASGRYLELELGPFGHYLVLQLRGRRVVHEKGHALEYAARREAGRWSGRAVVPVSQLPSGLHACNAYAVHGQAQQRRHLAAHPPGGSTPDFHRLESFAPLAWR